MALHQGLRTYLGVRRALGYKLERAGRLLPDFTAFLKIRGDRFITVEAALAWATQQTPRRTQKEFSRRLCEVRQFARYFSAIDPRTEIPPVDLLPARRRRSLPYLYSAADMRALLTAAQSMKSPFMASTYRTLLSLLACTGMRIGEGIALDRSDLDRRQGLLHVRKSKFGKSRLLPLDPMPIR